MVRDWIRLLLDTELWRFMLWIGLYFCNFAVLEGWGRNKSMVCSYLSVFLLLEFFLSLSN